MTPAAKKPRARTRWAVEWRYPGGKAWRLYASWPGRDDAEQARGMCAFQWPTREWRVYLKLGRAKSKLTPAKRRARNERSLKRDQYVKGGRAIAFERDHGQCVPRFVKDCSGRFEQAHHVIKSRFRRTHSDPQNLVGVCAKCHEFLESHLAIFWQWFTDNYPERLAYLEQLEREVATAAGKIAITALRYPEAPNAPPRETTEQSSQDPSPEVSRSTSSSQGPMPSDERDEREEGAAM